MSAIGIIDTPHMVHLFITYRSGSLTAKDFEAVELLL